MTAQLSMFPAAPAHKPAPFSNSQIAGLADEDLLSLYSTVGETVKARFLQRKPCLTSTALLTEYLHSVMAFEAKEQFRVLFLDKRNRLISDDVMQQGTVDHVPVYPREVAHRALNHGATAVILVHNHPSGDATPSRADIQMTTQLVDALKCLGIVVHDHIIVGRDGHASLKALRHM